MMIIDPVVLWDVTSNRPSSKNVYDKAGTLVTVPANQVAVTYDPSDLTKAPWVVVEPAATNRVRSSQDLTHAGAWASGANGLVPKVLSSSKSYRGIPFQEVAKSTTGTSEAWGAQIGSVAAGQVVFATFAIMAGTSAVAQIGLYALDFSDWGAAGSGTARIIEGPGQLSQAPYGGGIFNVTGLSSTQPTLIEISRAYAQATAAALYFYPGNSTSTAVGDSILVTRVQSEDNQSSSYWPTNPTFVSRASANATYYDNTGTMQTAAANVARMTYDPSNLSVPPRLMVENAAANLLPYSDDLFTPNLTKGPNITYVGTVADAPFGVTGHKYRSVTNSNSYITQAIALTGNTTYTFRYWLRLTSGVKQGSFYVRDDANGPVVYDFSPKVAGVTGWQEVLFTFKTGANSGTATFHFGAIDSPANYEFDIALAMVEAGPSKSSHIKTTGAAATRAADVVSYSQTRAADTIAAGAGLVYSNVAIPDTAYSIAATYAKDAQVYDPATYLMYQSLANANTGKALTDTTAWVPMKKSVNRWQMFDSYNNTQTVSSEEIIVVLSPQAISRGIYLGNVDATEVRISVVDLVEGLVYRETQSLVVSDSASSFYNWCFKRIRRKTYTVSVGLPPYANALITIAIRKPGGTAKCGVCAVGPLVDVGLSEYGLSREIRDFSTVNFNFDGTTNDEVIRNFAKRMDVDVSIDNDMIDSVIENLEAYRQKRVAWIGAKEFGSACVYGRYSSFKNVIPNKRRSQMNLQIEGTV